MTETTKNNQHRKYVRNCGNAPGIATAHWLAFQLTRPKVRPAVEALAKVTQEINREHVAVRVQRFWFDLYESYRDSVSYLTDWRQNRILWARMWKQNFSKHLNQELRGHGIAFSRVAHPDDIADSHAMRSAVAFAKQQDERLRWHKRVWRAA